ncbi:pectin lyase fold/virulence factor [Aspergillus transmontanensis]|uniref:Pectin lyase fold/virulence factor n=1 Tax=Aspergillus transmontanensis TaxID=1034304 RepID=A0A5N6VIR7_9EURO|nr:pectin lyase fold/virulence factor [Aspergillus transmontanensis]
MSILDTTYQSITAVLLGLAPLSSAVSVSGSAQAFAAGLTGGGDAEPHISIDINELKDSPWQSTWYTAAVTGMNVASNKPILGDGNKGIIKVKGLRFNNGVSNIIFQNVQNSDLNPEYVWGERSDLIWDSIVVTHRSSRQFAPDANTAALDSAPIFMVGEADQITMQSCYIYKTAGRSPALSGGTPLHAVNNVWEKNNGHELEGGESTARGIFEGSVWINVSMIVGGYTGRLFNTPDSSSAVNAVSNSGSFICYTDISFFSNFSGLTIASAVSASEAQANVPNHAGMGKF